MEVKQSVGMKVPVRLRAVVDGSPLSGVLFSEVTCYIQKQGGASTPVTLTALNWTEVDATNMPGEYDLTLEAADLNTVGFFIESVQTTQIVGRISLYPGLFNSSAPGLAFPSTFLRTAMLSR